MDNETNMEVYGGIVVPASALLKREHGNRYGSVPGLDDSELADPDELEFILLGEIDAEYTRQPSAAAR